MTAAHGVNVTRVLLTGMHAGTKVASEVDSPAQTGLRRDCGTPYPTPLAPHDRSHGLSLCVWCYIRKCFDPARFLDASPAVPLAHAFEGSGGVSMRVVIYVPPWLGCNRRARVRCIYFGRCRHARGPTQRQPRWALGIART